MWETSQTGSTRAGHRGPEVIGTIPLILCLRRQSLRQSLPPAEVFALLERGSPTHCTLAGHLWASFAFQTIFKINKKVVVWWAEKMPTTSQGIHW